ncbi:MAG: hypothetical protein WBO10_07160 [Pyrinomonadaceae bacterium]
MFTGEKPPEDDRTDETSITESNPKPTRAILPATIPTPTAMIASSEFQPMVR